nr:hypothetical protein [Bacteroidota bacterium]
MKKINILLGLILLSGLVFAQVDPPSNVKMKISFEDVPWGYDPYANIQWDLDETIDHYEVYLDGEEVFDETISMGFYYFYPWMVPLETNVYHDAVVIAVDANSVASDPVTFHFYFSETAYMRPTGLNCEYNPETSTALFTWTEPPFGGGEDEPTVTGYSVYLDGSYVSETSEPQYAFTELTTGINYVAGLVTHYSDGYNDSTFYQNYAKAEFYFDELTAPVYLNVDESTGVFTWGKPNTEGDVIGGTFTDYPIPLNSWEEVWFNPEELHTTFGNEEQFVNIVWYPYIWSHGSTGFDDMEGIWLDWDPTGGGSFNYARADDDIRMISEISGTSGLEWTDQLNVLDADTHEGIGPFAVLYNEDNGYYGAVRIDDVFMVDPDAVWGLDLTWWLQTNGSDDFSTAYNYYPNYYLIYLDDVLVDTVQPGYEQQFDNDYQYQFEGLVSGQSYSAGIEAVYYCGKSEMETIDFTNFSSPSSPEIQVDPEMLTQLLNREHQ